MLHFDNDVLRKYRDANPDPDVVDYLARHRTESWAISAVVLYEYLSYYETQAQRQSQRNDLFQLFDEFVEFDENTAMEAARTRSSLGDVGASLDAADLLIAATARQHGATLVTANGNDFDKTPIHDLMDVDIVDVS